MKSDSLLEELSLFQTSIGPLFIETKSHRSADLASLKNGRVREKNFFKPIA